MRTLKIKIPAKWDKEYKEATQFGRDVMLTEVVIKVKSVLSNPNKVGDEIVLDD